jgi:DNA-binding transcriptional MerR regulator
MVGRGRSVSRRSEAGAKAPDAFRTISEVAEELDLPQHVLRFWETRFSQIKPLKRGGGRRYYRPQDVELLKGIRHLLYGEGYTIRGVQRILREQGARFVIAASHGAIETQIVDHSRARDRDDEPRFDHEDEVEILDQSEEEEDEEGDDDEDEDEDEEGDDDEDEDEDELDEDEEDEEDED